MISIDGFPAATHFSLYLAFWYSAGLAVSLVALLSRAPRLTRAELVIGGLNLSGHNRTPQLLYFLERANEELERASLEKRSFIPHMVRSIEEEQL